MGWHVIVPEDTGELAGIPYIKYDPNTGSGAYMLGVIAGGTSAYVEVNTDLLKLVKYNIDKQSDIKVEKVEFEIYDPEQGKVFIWGDKFYAKIKMKVTYKQGDIEKTKTFDQDSAGNPFQMTIQTGPYIYDDTGQPIPWNNPGFYNITYDGQSIFNFYVWGPVLDYISSDKYIGISRINNEDTVGPPVTIRYSIKEMEGVTITSSKMQICDQNESVIMEIENIPIWENQEIVWDGRNSSGEIFTPGEYGIKIVSVGNGKEVPTKPHKVVVFKVEISTPVTTQMDISNVPAMPNITFNARFQPSTVKLSEVTFKWYLIITFRRDRQPADDENRIPIAGTTNIIGITEWTPGWGNLITGGNAHVYVTASIDGVESRNDQDGYQIRGTNPTQSQIFGLANTIEARAVCWQESTHRQFNAIRYTGIAMPLPSYARDGGYGLMMPTPASNEQVWNWRTNLQYGVDYLNRLRQDAQAYLNYWYRVALNTSDPGDDWSWNPADTAYVDRIWNEAFSRYGPHGGQGYLYSPNGNGGVENTTVPIYSYVQRVRGFINNPPW